jgi:dihydroorotate dehydrogenase (fumarate)
MADLRTTYMGLVLECPVIVSSSGITGTVEGVKRCADAGAGAVVLKSLFEELIVAKSDDLDLELLRAEHPEAYEYVRAEIGMRLGPIPYLKFIEDVRREVTIPVIASVNCVSPKWWVPYAKDLESAGASAIELNISHFPRSGDRDIRDIEKLYTRITAEVCDRVTIPVAVKLGFHFTSIEDVVRDIAAAGAKGIVLFNRYYTVDVDIAAKRFVPAVTFSSPMEFFHVIRWVGLLAGKVSCDIAASSGIHDAAGVIRALMAGATVACVCSALYRNGPGYLADIRSGLDTWLDIHGYPSVADIRGIANREEGTADILLHRLQYLKSFDEAEKYEY